MKRSLDKKQTQTNGSLTKTFQRSQMSFLNRKSKCMWTHGKDEVTSFYHVFTYIYSLLIEKDICDHQNVLVKLPCVCVCLLSRDLLIFSGKSFIFLFLFFCVIRTWYFPLHVVSHERKVWHLPERTRFCPWSAARCIKKLKIWNHRLMKDTVLAEGFELPTFFLNHQYSAFQVGGEPFFPYLFIYFRKQEWSVKKLRNEMLSSKEHTQTTYKRKVQK